MPSKSNNTSKNERPTLDEDVKASQGFVTRLFENDIRLKIIIALFVVLVGVLFLRLVNLQVVDAAKNKEEAVKTRTVSYTTTPKRGTIYDRNGNVLAVSKEAATIYVNPQETKDDSETAASLAKVLGGDASTYKDAMSDKEKKFAYIKRKVDVETGAKVKELNLAGVYILDDTKREYPYGRVAGQIVGSCNIDGDGLCGLELYYDDVLRGSSGKLVAQQGQGGMPIPGGTVQKTETIDGQDIMVAIDIELQQKVEDIISAQAPALGAENMNAVVVDPVSGEIYAMASLPLFDPTNISNTQDGATDIKTVSHTYEPGSTFKTVSAMAILENNVMTPDDTIFCPESIQADEYWVKDAHERSSMTMSFSKIIADSSNVGISLATKKLGYDKLYEKIVKYRFNEKTGVDYPGDTKGYLTHVSNWSTIQKYNVSFGQGISVTPLQIVDFYCALANNGVEPTPHLLTRYLQSDKDVEYQSYDVVENKAAIAPMTSMLRGVVTSGTGKDAEIPGFGVVGKTGTAEIADSNGTYLKNQYYNSFVGYLSQASQPAVCYVGGEKMSSDVNTAGVFKQIMQFTIERFNIAGKG